MTAIRPLRADDLPAVVRLYETELGGGSREAPPGMVEHFQRLFLDGPTTDPDIPALVYVDDAGSVGAFLGSTVRRMEIDGRPIRSAASGPLITEPDLRPVGALLLRRLLAGPQELTVTDRQTLAAQKLFLRLGGEISHLQCFRWTRVLQPAAYTGGFVARRDRLRPVAPLVHLAAAAADRIGRRVGAGGPPGPGPLHGEELTPATLADEGGEILAAWRLHPRYDAAGVAWQFSELRAMQRERGELHPRLLRDGDGRAVGWYVAFLRPGAVAQVMQFAARESHVGAVFDHLFHEADQGGATAVTGRLEPFQREPLRFRDCRFHQQACLVVHSRDPDVRAAVRADDAFVSPLEGEVWVSETLRADA